jgi:hypothetical protein
LQNFSKIIYLQNAGGILVVLAVAISRKAGKLLKNGKNMGCCPPHNQ